MPTGRLERVFALAGLTAIATLLALTIPAWLDYRDSRVDETTMVAPAGARPRAGSVTVTETVKETETVLRTVIAPPRPAVAPAPSPRPAQAQPGGERIALTATRGDCWLLVRAGSESGPQLFQGTVSQGRTLRFDAKRLWIRIGASENLDISLRERPSTRFAEGGIRTVVVTPKVVRAA